MENKVKEKTKKSEAEFKKLSNLTFEGILIHDKGIVIDVNLSFEKMFGYSRKELLGENIIDLIIPKKHHKIISKSIDKNYVLPFELEGIKKDGSILSIEIEAREIKWENNKTVRVAALRDITERNKSKENLIIAYEVIKENEESLNKILKTANEGFWMINLKNETLEVNPKMCAILGYSENEMVGKSVFDFVDGNNTKILKNQNEERISKLSKTYEIELQHKNGKKIYCLIKSVPLFNKENIRIGSFAMVTDISNLKNSYGALEIKNKKLKLLSKKLSEKNRLYKESNIRFKSLFEQSPVSLWEEDFSDVKRLLNKKLDEVSDLKLYLDEHPEFVYECVSKVKILNVNNISLDLMGVTTKEELGNHLIKTFNKKSFETFKEELVSLTSNNKEFIKETELVRSDGSTVSVIIKTVVLDDNKTAIVSMVNITDIKDAEKKLKKQNRSLIKAKDKAEESDRLKTEFLNNMYHEIRTPMNGILGFSEFLNDPKLDVKKRQVFIKIIQNSGNQLLRIIDDILEISKLETKQVKLNEEKCNLNDLLFELFSIFDLKSKENLISLYLEKGLSNEKSIILTDKVKLHKILSHLLENAFKFTDSGEINFGYQINKKRIEFFVRDTGIGIPKSKLETIFERFSQTEKELSKKVGGLGLGLSIAKENVMLLGGGISVESKMSKGSTFRFEIPFKPYDSDIDFVENKNS